MQSRIYCFDHYIIDPTRREFWDGDKQLSLELKVFDTLVYLLEHRDRTVCRDELISAVWGRVDVTDGNLSQVITHARHAVGDNAKKQSVIRTIPRHGYGWVLPVQESHVDLTLNGNGAGQVTHANGHSHTTGASSDIRVQSAVAVSPPLLRKTSRWLAPALAVMLLVSAVAFWSENGQEEAQSVPTFDQTALVLPVTVVSEENESWIRLGVMDLIADRLREAGQAVVPSDNTVALARSFNGDRQPTAEEIEELATTAVATLIMAARAESVNGHWRVTLGSLASRESPIIASAEAGDVLVAARAAADRIAVMLGYPAPASAPVLVQDLELDRLLQKTRSAVLSDRFDEAQAVLEQAAPELRKKPEVRLERADIESRRGNYAKAGEAFERLIDEWSPADDPVLLARAHYHLGFTHSRRLDYEQAVGNETAAIELLEGQTTYQARMLLGRTLMSRGTTNSGLRRFEEAQQDFARARVELESTGDQYILAALQANWGLVKIKQGRHHEAIPYLARSATAFQQFGAVQSELRSRAALMVAHLAVMQPAEAMDQEARIAGIYPQIGNPDLTGFINRYRIDALLANGRIAAAQRLIDQSLAWVKRQEREVHDDDYWPYAAAARHALDVGDSRVAITHAQYALDSPHTSEDARSVAQVWLALLRAQHRAGLPEAAAETLSAAQQWAVETGVDDPGATIYLTLARAEHAAFEEHVTEAERHFETVWNEARAFGVAVIVMQTAAAYAGYLIDQGRPRDAALVAGHTASWADQHYDAALLQLRLYHALNDAPGWRQAMARAQSLAGERQVPPELLTPPRPQPWVPESGEPPATVLAARGGPEQKP